MTRRLAASLVAWVMATTCPVSAQHLEFDGSFGYRSAALRLATSGQARLSLGSRIRLGTGLRLTYYAGEPRLFRNRGSVTSAFPDRIEIDPSVLGLNLMVSAEARVVSFLAVGANIDLAGVAVGRAQPVGSAVLKPARGSLFRYGAKDRGSLNSEFFLTAAVGRGLRVRGGLSHYVVGYAAWSGSERTRYQRFSSVPFLGVGWRL